MAHSTCTNVTKTCFTVIFRYNTEALLNYLERRGIPATFFVIGSTVNNFDTSKYLLKRMKREGHIVATHSSNHLDLSWMSEADILRNFEDPASTVEAKIGYRPRFMRPPFGSYSQAVIDVAKQNGFKVINWNVDSNDWRYSDYDRPSHMYSQIEGQEGPHRSSKIVLMHDQYFQKGTLDSVVKFYEKKGYYFVNMEDCLGRSAYF
jgi:peptidoglycan/xylan/chitin deacetylase (PgdA/CDA1 family)